MLNITLPDTEHLIKEKQQFAVRSFIWITYMHGSTYGFLGFFLTHMQDYSKHVFISNRCHVG